MNYSFKRCPGNTVSICKQKNLERWVWNLL